MSTQQIHRITPDNPPVFPCWCFHPRYPVDYFKTVDKDQWIHWEFDGWIASQMPTHWHPDQAEPPTERPGDDGSWDDFPPGGVHASPDFRKAMTAPDTATPLTDAKVEYEGEYTAIRQVVCADFARRLERDNARLKAALLEMVVNAEHRVSREEMECSIERARAALNAEAQP